MSIVEQQINLGIQALRNRRILRNILCHRVIKYTYIDTTQAHSKTKKINFFTSNLDTQDSLFTEMNSFGKLAVLVNYKLKQIYNIWNKDNNY